MSDTEAKKHKASDRKLRKKRQEGAIPNSQDSTGMLGTAAGLMMCIAVGIPAWFMAIDLIKVTPDRFQEPFDAAVEASMSSMLTTLQLVMFPIVGVIIAVSVTLTLIINKGFVFSTKPALPDLKRVSLSAGFKRTFGKRGWVELAVATLRLIVWIGFISVVIYLLLPDIVRSVKCGLHCQYAIASPVPKTVAFGAIVFLIVAAAADIIVQRDTFLEEQRMTETEQKRERKDQSGSKEIKQERSRIQQLADANAGVTLGSKDTTILFRAEKGLVGINYNPPDQPLPLICVKAKTLKDREALTKLMKQLDIPIMDNERIVSNTIGKGKTEMLDIKYFRDFAIALASR